MKKSQLRKIIKESIKGLLIEGGNCQKLEKVNPSDLRDETSKESMVMKDTWKLCSLTVGGIPIPVTAGGFTGAFSFAGLGPTSGPGVNATLAAFYPWVVGQVGPIAVGDYITFDMLNSGMCSLWANGRSYTSVNKICLEYLGTSNNPPGLLWGGPSAIAVADDCCGPCAYGMINVGDPDWDLCQECQGMQPAPSPWPTITGDHCECCEKTPPPPPPPPDPCIDPLWTSIPLTIQNHSYCKRCLDPAYNGNFPVDLIGAPSYYAPNPSSGTNYCDCCNYEEPCKKCCCKKKQMPNEQVEDPFSTDEPAFGGCVPGTKMVLPPSTDPCECPVGYDEIPYNKCKETGTLPINPVLQPKKTKPGDEEEDMTSRFQKLANI